MRGDPSHGICWRGAMRSVALALAWPAPGSFGEAAVSSRLLPAKLGTACGDVTVATRGAGENRSRSRRGEVLERRSKDAAVGVGPPSC